MLPVSVLRRSTVCCFVFGLVNVPAVGGGFTPQAQVFFDYHVADADMLGATIALQHYDENYPRWGYYLGYALGKTEKVAHDTYQNYEIKNQMWRLGLSYNITTRYALYAGTLAHQYTHDYQERHTQLCADCEPDTHQDRKRKWGAEVGVRAKVGNHLHFGVGYNQRLENVQLSVGYGN